MNATELETIKRTILAKHAQLAAIRDELATLVELVQELHSNADVAADYLSEAYDSMESAIEVLTEEEPAAIAA